ncbi:PAS domain-containing protein [Larkinella bovis]|uniref:histidine kinase n=1 Tax=Larkinella bovis TaxID=683041 RepID=A0ABW0I5T5_9BACT
MNTADRTPPQFLTGGGEVGHLLRSFDWSGNPLGEPDQWPQSLKTAVSIVLRSGYPMFIWWGPHLINIHNDAYIPLMGHKHPAFLGKPAPEIWYEIWEESLLPMKNRVFDQQESVYGQELMLLLERKEFPEEGYFNFSYSPIIDETGQVGGLFCACHEETDKVLRQRRLQTLNELSSRITPAPDRDSVGRAAIEVLTKNYKDLPFSAFYLLDAQQTEARLSGTSGVLANDAVFAQTVPLQTGLAGDFWNVQAVAQTGEPALIENVSEKITALQHAITDRLPDRAYVLPIQPGNPENRFGVLVFGLSPHRAFDTEYRIFLEMIGAQIATVIDTLEAHEMELQRSRQLAEIDRVAQETIAQNRQKADEHVRSIIHQAPVGIAVLMGDQFVFEAANETYGSLVDKHPDEILGKPMLDALPELRGQGITELLANVVKTGQPYFGNEFPVTLNRAGRPELVYFNFIYQPLRRADQSVSGIIVVANDVTELVTSKYKLQESERQFRNLVIQSPIAMAIFRGPEFIIEIANETMLKTLWKRTLREVQGKKLLDIFPELRDQPYPQLLTNVLQTGISHTDKEALTYIKTKAGVGKYYLDYEYAPLFGTDNRVAGIMVTVNDVSEKVLARISINEAEQRSRLAIEAAEMGTYDLDLETGGFLYSERLAAIFGLARHQPFPRIAFEERIHPDDLPVRARAYEQALKTGRLLYEVRLKESGGQIPWVRVVGSIIFNEQKQPVRLLGAAIDITQQVEARKSLEEAAEVLEKRVEQRTLELQNSNHELLRTNHELEQFAYIASHDLQEPLRKIQTFSELLRESLHDEASSQVLLEKISSSAQRMSALIRGVLNFSRLSKTDEQFVPTDLNQILASVKTDFELLLEQKGAILSQDTLPTIPAIPLQLTQLFTNLIGNSLKFSEKNPVIHISSSRPSSEEIKSIPPLNPDKTYIKLTFKDNGIGFDQNYAEQIFIIFHRLNGRKSYSGTGIGLALCKKIVENHQGFIAAESTPDQGATFSVYLPT